MKLFKNLFFLILACLIFFFTSCSKCECEIQTECLADPKPNLICTEQYEPVCGCDSVTYSNSCYAQRVGATSWSNGECD